MRERIKPTEGTEKDHEKREGREGTIEGIEDRKKRRHRRTEDARRIGVGQWRMVVLGTFGEGWQSERKIQEENLLDSETNAGSGRKERRQAEMGMGEFEKGRESREQYEGKQFGEQRLHFMEPWW